MDVLSKRVFRLSLTRHSFHPFTPSMFARAIQVHQHQQLNSSQTKPPATVTVQKPLDFGGVNKRKAFDVIEDHNKRAVIDRGTHASKRDRGSTGLIAAMTKKDSFANGQVLIDGEVFDEADFDDIGFDDWDVPATVKQVTQVTNHGIPNPTSQEDYFKDDDMDWEDPLAFESNVDDIQPHIRSSPPIALVPPILQRALNIELPTEVTLQNKENTFPPPVEPLPPAPVSVEPESLAKIIFPSSELLPWSSSPVAERITTPPPPKRSLPWISNPNRYGTVELPTSQYRKEQSPIKSIVRTATNTTRNISTMAMEHPPIDWDVLGITEKDIFERQKRERMEELQRKGEVARRGTEWIDQAPLQATVPAPRRRRKVEEKPQEKLLNKPKALAKVFLSQEQLSVRKLVVEGKKSVFFTGSAGIFPTSTITPTFSIIGILII